MWIASDSWDDILAQIETSPDVCATTNAVNGSGISAPTNTRFRSTLNHISLKNDTSLSCCIQAESAARPDLYVTCVEGKIVVKNNLLGAVDEWLVTLHEGLLVTFEATGEEEESCKCISFEDRSLVFSNNAFRFYIEKSPWAEGLYAFGLPSTTEVWALSANFDGAPVIIQPDTGTTAELFQRVDTD